MTTQSLKKFRRVALVTCLACLAAACGDFPTRAAKAPLCEPPREHRLDVALEETKSALAAGCRADYDAYMARLLETAEGDPKPENKRLFSEFLLWSTDQGLLSKRQAQSYYNRYFNTKFVSLLGDYNNCAYTCPRKDRFLVDMQRELKDKEQGLLRVSRDQEAYYRADRLFQEAELVLEATCRACAAAP